MAQTSEIRKGMIIMHNNEPQHIVEADFYSPGKGSAFTRVKLKSLSTGKVIPFTFRSGEKVEELEVTYKDVQYLYKDEKSCYFMDPQTYEQLEVSLDVIKHYTNFMKEGGKYVVILYMGKIIYVKFPPQLEFVVTETTNAVKGNTVSNATKEAKIETGAIIQVPLFIKNGDTIKVNPETGEYQGRA